MRSGMLSLTTGIAPARHQTLLSGGRVVSWQYVQDIRKYEIEKFSPWFQAEVRFWKLGQVRAGRQGHCFQLKRS